MKDNHLDTESCVHNDSTISPVEKKTHPTVFRLRLELVDFFGNETEWYGDELAVLRKYAKVKTGFWREVLVPASMRLKSLHFIIQTLFGWQNSHLHNFTLPENIFMAVTNNGDISKWEELCGVLFHFPENYDSDRYIDEIYNGLKPYKEWVKEKYSNAKFSLCISDTYIKNQTLAEEFEKCDFKKSLGDISTIDKLNGKADLGESCDTLLERLTIDNLLRPKKNLPDIAEWKNIMADEIKAKQQILSYFSGGREYSDLIEKFNNLQKCRNELTEAEEFKNRIIFLDSNSAADDNISHKKSNVIASLENIIETFLLSITPDISPPTDTLLYRYDYGDGWSVKVICEEGYYTDEECSRSGEWGNIVTSADSTENSDSQHFYSSTTNEKAPDELTEFLLSVVNNNTPVCIAAEGIRLLDDVGGIHGFVDMLRIIHGNDKNEAEDMREWAKEMGWSNRMPKPEKML